MSLMRIYFPIVLVISMGIFSGCGAKSKPPPQLIFDDTVAADFRLLADETWALFRTTFATRTDCFGDVTLRTDPNLESRAAYEPERAIVTVKVPGTPAFLQAALVHEWAHHVEFQCEAHHSLRPALLASLDLPSGTPWRTSHEWNESPSEQYAEAVVELVLGDHPLPTKIRVKPESVAVLHSWTKGN